MGPRRVFARRRTPNGLEQRVLARARAAGFGAGDRIIVGFSGGRDSLALAASLLWTERKLGIETILVHVDHQLRTSSAEESQRAERLAKTLGMEFEAVTIGTLPVAAHPGVGMEEAARRERYRILFDAAALQGARAVAVAHHQADQAETVLLHLLRGGGVHGASGMAECAPAPIPTRQDSNDISHEAPWLWRPFLLEPRESIVDFVREIGLQPVEDPTNDDTRFRRNAIRNVALPLLDRHFPQARSALARYGTLAAEDDRFLEELARSALSDIVNPGGLLSAEALHDRPLALQRRIVRIWLKDLTSANTLTADRTDAVLDLIRRAAGRRQIEIGEGWTVRLERGMLCVMKSPSQVEEGP